MADEITKLSGDGGNRAQLLFLYKGLTPVTYNSPTGVKVVVPSPFSALQAVSTVAANILTVAEQTELDNGTSAWEIHFLDGVIDSKTNSELITEARLLYATKKAEFIERYNRAWRWVGVRANEV